MPRTSNACQEQVMHANKDWIILIEGCQNLSMKDMFTNANKD